jgi:hypothetical protein
MNPEGIAKLFHARAATGFKAHKLGKISSRAYMTEEELKAV